MNDYDGQLRSLAEQTARKRQLDAELESLEARKFELERKLKALEQKKHAEQADVDRLERRSLTAFFYRLAGKRDEALTREREEAWAAAMQYEAAIREQAALEEEIQRCREGRAALHGCEDRYKKLMAAKMEAVRASGSAEGMEILKLEDEMVRLAHQRSEIDEAIAAGRGALRTADAVLENLEDADGLATWDLLGGGLIADMAKHSHLDEAQSQVEQLQIELQRFRTELADVAIDAAMQVSVDGFLRFADYFFDGLFADLAVMDRIGQSKSRVAQTRAQVAGAIDRLDGMRRETDRRCAEARRRIDELVRQARL